MEKVSRESTPKHLPRVNLVAWLNESENIIASSAKLTITPKDFTSIMESLSPEKKNVWIRELVSRGHGSPLEHSIYVFEVVCSRACSHQLVRHRHASYSQLSQRYSDRYLKGLVEKAFSAMRVEFSEDPGRISTLLYRLVDELEDFETLLDLVAEGFIVPPSLVETRRVEPLKQLLMATAGYYEALASQTSYEDARYLLPQAVKTRLLVSMNARELLEVFLPLRMCARAQWEIRMVAWGLWSQLVEVHPTLFNYAGPRCVLYENRTRLKPCTLDDYLRGECSFTIQKCPEHVPNSQISQCLTTAWNALKFFQNS
ncbi:MAG: FAD-dependent thymidylate synthase [Thermosphaera sp.]